MSVCFVILHYAAIEETVNCIQSILGNVCGEKEIIVVDNASPNGSGKKLEDLYRDTDHVTVLFSDRNLGFARGNNLGYEYAVRVWDPDFIVVMNNDMVIEQKDFIDCIYDSYRQWHFGIMGPDIYSTKILGHQNPQTKPQPSMKWLRKKYLLYSAKYYLRGLMFAKNALKDLADRGKKTGGPVKEMDNYVDHVVENAFLHASCYIFSRDFIARNPRECFYNRTFMYMEAEILKYLADRDNIRTIYDPGCRVIHHEDAATDQTYSRRNQKAIFAIRNLRDSTRIFMDLIESDEKRKGRK